MLKRFFNALVAQAKQERGGHHRSGQEVKAQLLFQDNPALSGLLNFGAILLLSERFS